MEDRNAANGNSTLRLLPSIDELIGTEPGQRISSLIGRARAAALAREVTDVARAELRGNFIEGSDDQAVATKEGILQMLAGRMENAWRNRQSGRLQRVINATGVIVHTNLGRAPLSEAAVAAIANEARGYCTLEYDRATGKRGRRGAYAEDLLAELTGAEAALVVNNCAAAAFLVLTVFAARREVIVSRGELVEIGGDFRVPDVLAQSGAILREVGTTNRTKIADYEKAISENTAMILRVHPSNYRIIGFTETPQLEALASLAREKKILLYEDAGSGALIDLTKFGMVDEPVISRSIADGAGLVTFSGDKLLGGPQSGIIVGSRDLVEQIRKHPLYRALRVDKLIYAALEATVEAYALETAEYEVPVLKTLSMTKEELSERAQKFAERLAKELPEGSGLDVTTVDGRSAIGGGAAPMVQPKTTLVALAHAVASVAEIEKGLRASNPPVIARIVDDRVLIDLRTAQPAEEDELLSVIVRAADVLGRAGRRQGQSQLASE
jgi:L-seryl-tRNA(Ser) seleniumtransferase